MKRKRTLFLSALVSGLLIFSAAAGAAEVDKETVRQVQEVLNSAGFECGTADGLFGSKTENAIRQYQEANQLTVDGTISDELLESMGLAQTSQEAAQGDPDSAEVSVNNEQAWDELYLYLSEHGTDINGMKGIQKIGEDRTTCIVLAEGDTEAIHLITSADYDSLNTSLELTLKKNEALAEFTTGTRLDMEFSGVKAYTDEHAYGHTDISVLTSQTLLSPERYEQEALDINGNTNTSTDISQFHSDGSVRQSLNELLRDLPDILSAAGLDISMNDLGFYANLDKLYGIELGENETICQLTDDVYCVIPGDWSVVENANGLIAYYPPENTEKANSNMINFSATKIGSNALSAVSRGEQREPLLDTMFDSFRTGDFTMVDEQTGIDIGGFQGRSAHSVLKRQDGDCDLYISAFLVDGYKLEDYIVLISYGILRDGGSDHQDVYQRMIDTIYVDTDGSYTASLTGGSLSGEDQEETAASQDAGAEAETASEDPGEGAEAASEDSGEAQIEQVTLSLEDAEATFVGWMRAPEGYVAQKGYTDDQCFIALFEYTNLEDAQKQMSQDFWVRCYQNGVELDSVSSSYNGVCKEAENRFKMVIQGGKITVGWPYFLEDDSPVTVIMNEQGSSNSVKTEITLD